MTRPADVHESTSTGTVTPLNPQSILEDSRNAFPGSRAQPDLNEGSNPPDRGLSRSPVLSSLPENGVPTQVEAQPTIGITDFAPSRKDTGSTSSMSEYSENLRSSRSSIAGHVAPSFQTQNNCDIPLQPRQIQRLAAAFDTFKTSLRTDAVPRQQESRRAPLDSDFANVADSLSWKIRRYGSGQAEGDVAYVVICLHDSGRDESAWMPFAKKHLAHPQTVFLFLGGIRRIRAQTNGQGMGLHWSDEGPDGNTFQRATRLILEEVIVGILITKCNIPPRNIAIMGEGQGGTAAITMACAWGSTRLGGIVSLNGPSPEYIVAQSRSPKIPIPILVMGGDLGEISPHTAHRIRNLFLHVDTQLLTGAQELALETLTTQARQYDAQLLSDFLAHALRQEEWETQSILTFDGGGIRGYGSLLIMKDLMRRIGIEEKRMNSLTTSSFYPEIYRPTTTEPGRHSSISTADSLSGMMCETPIEGLENSDLFLPCHYFTYVGGTSTGGLIGIMLSRFRMSVDDCIAEYKTLGRKVFAHPRPLSMGGLSWHKFSAQPLTAAIQDVTNRHCFKLGPFGVQFPSDPDLCRTVVLAYSENATTEAPYLFRTYRTFKSRFVGQPPGPGSLARETTLKIHNPGAPSDVEIPLVGRATSAAPSYFPPVRVPITDSNGDRTTVRFKDGGFGSNNPSLEVFRDVKHKHGGLTKNVNTFVSIGTGQKERRLFNQEGWTRAATRVREAYANWKALKAFPTHTEEVHNIMENFATQDNVKMFEYFRFDGGSRLGQIKMDEWKSNTFSSALKLKHAISGSKTLREIEDAVAVYLSKPEVQSQLDECARLLVKRRRLRLRDKYRWDRYASASWYECPFPCNDPTEYKTFTSFEDHVRGDHNHDFVQCGFQNVEELAEKRHCRRCWLYPRKETASVPAAAVPAEG